MALTGSEDSYRLVPHNATPGPSSRPRMEPAHRATRKRQAAARMSTTVGCGSTEENRVRSRLTEEARLRWIASNETTTGQRASPRQPFCHQESMRYEDTRVALYRMSSSDEENRPSSSASSRALRVPLRTLVPIEAVVPEEVPLPASSSGSVNESGIVLGYMAQEVLDTRSELDDSEEDTKVAGDDTVVMEAEE